MLALFYWSSIEGSKPLINAPAQISAMISDTTADNLTAIDTFAMNAPTNIDQSPETVGAYLVKRCANDLQKARAAFAWVATHIRYDDNAYNSGNIGDQSAPVILKRKHGVCEGYSNLYKAIGEAMGLEVQKIEGYAKAYGYHAGERFEGSDPNHAWNAVKINGEWAFVDATWGSGHAEGGRGHLVSRKVFTPYWFNVNRYEFLFKHYPQDAQWLLVPESVSLKQYQEMPQIEEPFFMLGFDAHDILQKALAKTLPKQLPEAYITKFHVKQLGLPLSGSISESAEASFSVMCDEDVDIVVANNVKQFASMKKNGNIYAVQMPIKKGDLVITVRDVKSKGPYADIMRYKVVK